MAQSNALQTEKYPFAEELLTDKKGQVLKVVLQLKDYLRLIEAVEDEALYQAINQVREETPVDMATALEILNSDES